MLSSSGSELFLRRGALKTLRRIAAEILMPADCFRGFWKNDFSIKDLFQIARLFETSIAADSDPLP